MVVLQVANDSKEKIETVLDKFIEKFPKTTSLNYFINQKRIVELAAKWRLPAIYSDTDWIDAGGLISYGTSLPDLHRRAAV